MHKAERIRTIIEVNYVFVIHKIRTAIYNMDGKHREIFIMQCEVERMENNGGQREHNSD